MATSSHNQFFAYDLSVLDQLRQYYIYCGGHVHAKIGEHSAY